MSMTPAADGASRRRSWQSLDGKRVHIGGYVVPLDFEATTVKEFLLVPFVGACIHVPPPPANQIVYVKVEQGLRRAGHVRSGVGDGHAEDRRRPSRALPTRATASRPRRSSRVRGVDEHAVRT